MSQSTHRFHAPKFGLRFLFILSITLLFYAVGCGGEYEQAKGDAPILELGEPKAIFNGQTSPDLYPDIPMDQQNAVMMLIITIPGVGMAACTGTLISPQIVLTAAHCVHDNDSGRMLSASNFEIRVGPEASRPINTLRVREVRSAAWTGSERHDMAILVLSAPYTQSTPIDIKKGGVSGIYNKATQSVGFGQTDYNDNTFNTTRFWTSMPVYSYSDDAITVYGEDRTGIGHGDSGGPLLYDFGDGIRVIGVASTGTDLETWDRYVGNYSPVSTNEMWIQAIVDEFDNPECQAICQGVECGEHEGCSCGICIEGYQCTSMNTCEIIPHGVGGVCISGQPTGNVCQSNDQCQGEQLCMQYSSQYSECGMPCGPQTCSPNDQASWCIPIQGGQGICIEDNPESCTNYNNTCTTSDGRQGYCGQIMRGGPVGCYTFCAPVSSCPSGTGCRPAPGLDPCEEVCGLYDCGQVDGCSCGTCDAGLVCRDNYCEPPCSCDGKECGDDGCGNSCGTCGQGERCTEDFQCEAMGECSGACGDVQGYCIDESTACLCREGLEIFGAFDCNEECPPNMKGVCERNGETGDYGCSCEALPSDDECEGSCSPLDAPYCLDGGDGICECLGMEWTIVDCRARCDENETSFLGCAVDNASGKAICQCDEGDDIVLDPDDIGDGETDEGEGFDASIGDRGCQGTGHSHAAGFILLLLGLGFVARFSKDGLRR